MLEQVDIREVWGRAEDMLNSVLEKSPQDWKAVDVYSFCVAGRATCFMSDDDDSVLVIASINQNPYTGEDFLFVWVAYHPGEHGMDTYLPQVEELARNHGCKYIEFESKRRAFARDKRWVVGNTTYRKEV